MAKNNKVIKEQNIDQNLQERYEEMKDFLLDLIEDHKRAEEDLKYLKDFVHYKRLDEEFRISGNMHMRMKTRNFRFHTSRCNN